MPSKESVRETGRVWIDNYGRCGATITAGSDIFSDCWTRSCFLRLVRKHRSTRRTVMKIHWWKIAPAFFLSSRSSIFLTFVDEIRSYKIISVNILDYIYIDTREIDLRDSIIHCELRFFCKIRPFWAERDIFFFFSNNNNNNNKLLPTKTFREDRI